jgi:hypothetical protein
MQGFQLDCLSVSATWSPRCIATNREAARSNIENGWLIKKNYQHFTWNCKFLE